MHPTASQEEISFWQPSEGHPEWLQDAREGELALDVFREGGQLVIRSPIAGVSADRLELHIHGDVLTIRGEREACPELNDDDWFCRECYWGAFSRSVVLPYDVYSERAQAVLKNGVLEIRLPIRSSDHRLAVHEKF